MEPIKLNRPARFPSRDLGQVLADLERLGTFPLSPWTMYGAVSLKFYSAAPRRTPSGGVISYYGRGI